MTISYSCPYITRGKPLAGLAPRAACLFMEFEARWSDLDAIPVGQADEDGAQQRINVVADKIAALQPRSVAEAAALLQAVFRDDDEEHPDLPDSDQVAVLENVKASLTAHVAAMPERTL